LASEFDVSDFEECGADFRSAEKFETQTYGMGLGLRGESGLEMFGCYGEEAAGNKTSMRYRPNGPVIVKIGFISVRAELFDSCCLCKRGGWER
jgi:hypothetical protein